MFDQSFEDKIKILMPQVRKDSVANSNAAYKAAMNGVAPFAIFVRESKSVLAITELVTGTCWGGCKDVFNVYQNWKPYKIICLRDELANTYVV